MTKVRNRLRLLLALGMGALILSTVLACGGDSKSQYDDLNWCNADVQDALVELEEDANIDAKIYEDGATLVHQVARCNEAPSVVTLLLDRGADIDARDDHGQSPLHNAARYNQEPSVIEVLLDGGADIDTRDDLSGSTPLHEAAGFNEEPAVTQHCCWTVVPKSRRGTKSGETPLHNAATYNQEPLVTDLLLDRGAEIEAKNILLGRTPLHSAAGSFARHLDLAIVKKDR